MADPEAAAMLTAEMEECLDQLGECVALLGTIPPRVLALAMRTQLMFLLQELLQQRLCGREEMREFLAELQQDVLSAALPD